jgi:Spy/CpxP family protein refolding chaperone
MSKHSIKDNIMFKNILGIAALICSFSFSQAVLANSPHCKGAMKGVIESLKLDAAQKEKIIPLMEQLKSSMKETGTKLHDLDKQINQQVDSDSMKLDTVNGLIDQKTTLINTMMKANLSTKNEIMMLLTADQKKELHEKMSEKFKECYSHDQ